MDYLNSYGSDSNESEDEILSEMSNPKKQKVSDELSLPSFFDSDEESEVIYTQRIRHFPHMKGSWPTFIYLNLNELNDNALFARRKEKALKMISQNSPLEWNPTEDLHISLTKPFALKHHEIDYFWNKLKEALQENPPAKLDITFKDCSYFTNDEKNTSFFSMNVSDSNRQQIINIISIVDKVMQTFGYPTYYKDPKPHASLFWAVGGDSINKVPTKLMSCFGKIEIEVSKLSCKIGKRLHEYLL